jgi:Protein of unknown function (DUF1572)
VNPEPYLDDVRRQLRKYQRFAERAVAQIAAEDLFRTLDPEALSIALIMKHVAGNMRSRWTDFLTTDGEKPDRGRDAEFERETGDTREAILARWEAGWTTLFSALEPLAEEDLGRTVTIRGEPHTVLQAIQRQLTHYAYHVGQIVLLAKQYAGPGWQTLSIAKGKSREFDVAKDGSAYRLDPGGR